MISRVADIHARAGDGTQAVHVWGRDFEECAVACELQGSPVVRLESGGFCAAWNVKTQAQVHSGQFQVEHEVLDWEVVEWRELGRYLFKPTVADKEEDEHSQRAEWGTDDLVPSYERELAAIIQETAQRLQKAHGDVVLVMSTWRVFDRQRGLLTARFGLGAPDSEADVEVVLSFLPYDATEKQRLKQLWTAAQAWW